MKPKTVYVCQSCGLESPRWEGRCPSCGGWNSLVETVAKIRSSVVGKSSLSPVKAQRLADLSALELKHFPSGISEFDRTVGGGLVSGEVILLAGEPGIGKSTLLLQLLKGFGGLGGDVVFVCGEESPLQVKSRALRLGVLPQNLVLYPETNVDLLKEYLEITPPALVIVDSIQTLVTEDLGGAAGSIGQVRECAFRLTQLAKKLGFPLILVGHVTKEGGVAGPKVLEHLVDAVLSLEGDSRQIFRILRVIKNRFGPIFEVGVFEMTPNGLFGVDNPSDRFLEERLEGSPGSVVTVLLEGLRPVLLEVQALVTATSFGFPRRTASGFSLNRLLLLLAVIEKSLGLKLQGYDVYVNIAAGLEANETAADLAVCLAIVSSLRGVPFLPQAVALGEVGLSGEIRRIPQESRRLEEAKRLGYLKAICPGEFKTLRQAVAQSLR